MPGGFPREDALVVVDKRHRQICRLNQFFPEELFRILQIQAFLRHDLFP